MSDYPLDYPKMFGTLSAATLWVRARLDSGVKCPCCMQHAQMYRRRINASGVRALIALYRGAGERYVHAPSLPGVARAGGEFARLAYWGLIEDDALRPGYWHITELGLLWLKGDAAVPKFALVYNGELIRLDGPEIFIAAAVGTKFNLAELLAGR